MTSPLLIVRNLNLDFIGTKIIRALNDLNFELNAGESLVLVGESGSGKSVTLKSLLRLYKPSSIQMTGEILFDGQSIQELNQKQLQSYRGKDVSMVFQEAGTAFDPVYTIGEQIIEMILAHEAISYQDAKSRALELLDLVKIPQAKQRLLAYPHELSGGMKQRAMIALSLACRPKILLADEPTTALDATVQIQILLLLRELQQELNMAMIFVTHDIGAAVEISDQIAVMYGGTIVEKTNVSQFINKPFHPYSHGLLASNVTPDQKGKKLMTIAGSPPIMDKDSQGCAFAPRCSFAIEKCITERPISQTINDSQVSCWKPILENT
jgi:peptide/nickel transport system ATP-binding protein